MRTESTTTERLRLLLCLLALLFAGCADVAVDSPDQPQGVSGEDGKADQMSATGDSNAPGTGVQGDPPLEAPTLSNQYAITMRSWISVADADDAEDDPDEWTAGFRGLVSTKVEDGQVIMRVAPCDLELPDISDREVEVNELMIQRASPAVLRTDLTWDENSARLSTDLGAMVAGVDLADPVNDALPSDDDDDRLVDVDEDGRPALTLKISGYRVYVVLRAKMALDGQFQTDGLIRGTSGLRVDLEVYGDSVPFVDVKEHLDEALGKLSLTDERHEFVMVPLDNAVETCSDIPTAAFSVPTSDPSSDTEMGRNGVGDMDEPAPTPAEPAPTPADED